jgi:hypothetical protein
LVLKLSNNFELLVFEPVFVGAAADCLELEPNLNKEPEEEDCFEDGEPENILFDGEP